MVTGSGTSADPYILSTFADLELIGTGVYTLAKYYKLGDNIDASPTADPGYNSGAGWLPIGNSTTQFTGYFDGNNKTISGLYINRPTTDNVGFFGYVNRGSEFIKNLTLTGSVSGQSNVGLLVGYVYAGTITTCNCNGTVTGSVNQIGGIVGQVRTITITGSTMQGTVTGSATSDNIGGIVGYNSNASCIITSCTNEANVSGRNNIGGIQGYAYCDYYFTSCTVTANINGNNAVGGLIGGSRSAGCVSRIITSSYEGTITGVNYVGGLGGQCLILGANTYTNNCTIKGSIIGTGSQIGGAYGQFRSAITDTNIIAGELTIITNGIDYVGGLIGYVQDYAYISNCDIAVNITARDYVGGLIGYSREANNNCIIINSSYEGDLSGRSSIGGLIGYNGHYGSGTLFSYSTVKGSITATGTNIGGVAGYCRGYIEYIDITDELTFNVSNCSYVGGIVGSGGSGQCSIRYCNVSLNITAQSRVGGIFGNLGNYNAVFQVYNNTYKGSISGTSYIGGIGGYCEYYGVDSRINNCSVEGVINATGDYVAGIVGYSKAQSLYNNTVTNLVIYAPNSSYVGGVVGYVPTYLSVYNNKILATITALDYVGGIIGNSYSGNFWINCYLNLFKGNIIGRNYIGGIGGYLRNINTGATSIITKCYSIGSIVASGDYIGGLGGHIRPVITNCFSQMAVEGNSNIGGLVGYKTTNNITNCYSKGLVVGNSNIGGLVGVTSVATATNSYWDTQTSGQSTSALGTGMTTDQLTYEYDESAYSGWDFATPIWSNIGANQYPWLVGLPRYFLVTGIASGLSFGLPELFQATMLLPTGIDNSISLGVLKLNLKLYPESIDSSVGLGLLGLYLKYIILGEGLENIINFGNINLGCVVSPTSIENISYIGNLGLYLRNHILINGLDSTFNSGNIKLNLKVYLDSLENISYIGDFRPALAPNFNEEGIENSNGYGFPKLNLKLFIESLESGLEIPLPLIILFLKPTSILSTEELGFINVLYALRPEGIDNSISLGLLKLNLKLYMASLLSESDMGLVWIYIWYNNQYANFEIKSPSTNLEILKPGIVIQILKPVTSFNIKKPITEFNLLEPQTIFSIKG